MDSDTNLIARIIATIICIVIGVSSLLIAYETHEEIQSTIVALDDRSYYDFKGYVSGDDWRRTDWKRDVWYKARTRQESSQYAILYASTFVSLIYVLRNKCHLRKEQFKTID